MAARRLKFKPYVDLQTTWPEQGRAILAHYNADSVVVYQAFDDRIGRAAAQDQSLAVPGFDLDRMSWIKPGFLWMMRRSEWATDQGQTTVLAIWLRREAFDGILRRAVHSTFTPEVYESREAWQAAVDGSEVRVQWDPDYPPHGPKLKRRAIQLGLRGETLRRYSTEWIVQIEDITPIVRQQAEYRAAPDFLLVPAERLYPVADQDVARRLLLDKSAAPQISRKMQSE